MITTNSSTAIARIPMFYPSRFRVQILLQKMYISKHYIFVRIPLRYKLQSIRLDGKLLIQFNIIHLNRTCCIDFVTVTCTWLYSLHKKFEQLLLLYHGMIIKSPQQV